MSFFNNVYPAQQDSSSLLAMKSAGRPMQDNMELIAGGSTAVFDTIMGGKVQHTKWTGCDSYPDTDDSGLVTFAVAFDSLGNLWAGTSGSCSCYLDVPPNFPGCGLWKYNRNLELLWADGALGNGIGQVDGIAIDDSDNIYVISNGGHLGTYLENRNVVKYDNDGNLIWAVDIAEDKTFFVTIAIDPTNTYLYLGDYSNSVGNHRILVKLRTSDGSVVWIKWRDERNMVNITGISIDSDGNLYCATTGSSYSYQGTTYPGYGCTKLDSNGNIIWRKAEANKAYAVIVDGDFVYFAGNGEDPEPPEGVPHGYHDVPYYNLRKLKNSDGSIVWGIYTERGGFWGNQWGFDWLRGIAVDNAGYIYTVGKGTSGSGSVTPKMYKYTPVGKLVWRHTLGKQGTCLAVDDTSKYFAIGVDIPGI